MKRNYKNLAVSLLVGTAIFGSIYPATLNAITSADAYTIPQTAASTSPVAATPPPAVLTVKEASQLDIWLEKLAQVESQGKDHIKILDVNGRYSYGCLQFQENTFRNYGARYGLVAPGANIETIYDCNLQKKIAKRMIQDDYVLWQSWYTSVVEKGLGLPPAS